MHCILVIRGSLARSDLARQASKGSVEETGTGTERGAGKGVEPKTSQFMRSS